MKFIRKLHYILSLVVGLQLMIWLVSGFYFNVMDSEKVSGNQYKVQGAHNIVFDLANVMPIENLLVSHPNIVSIDVVNVLGSAHYLAYFSKALYPHFKQDYQLFEVTDLTPFTITKDIAKQIATLSYNGSGQPFRITLMEKPIELLKQKNASWRVDFDDQVNTSVYVDAHAGHIIGHTDDNKRFADFFFMLHFMDYAKEGSFNNYLMMFFSVIAFWLSLTGTLWVSYMIRKGQYKVRLKKKPRLN
ncbi:hypothetical protein [Thalassotalea eurytherma]|uniref:PepSY domain-containing protein n=1 Tax=Thalassotalea eurytherma TaxID=1144278 RepID=A0ABQ6H639_9GAMM|nr:hypothetical protein [Thalassotalea eurytherma]GLX81906.1 hypothetical protein theurythT_13580 [Thalassotalea eurytherma]